MIQNFNKIFVLDTNIILQDYTNLIKLSKNNNLIVLPEVVLDEIDNKKSGFGEINFQARAFARFLENSKIISSKHKDKYNIIRLSIDDIFIDIISTKDFKISSSIENDRKILEITNFAKEYYNFDVEFISNDVMARLRAVSVDIKSSFLKGSDDFDFEFYKEIEIEFDELEKLDNAPISKYDKDYKIYNFSYCFKVKYSDLVFLASIKNKKINVLDEEFLRDQIIMPLNKEQLFFSNALLDSYYKIIIVEALAGSGKTLLALSGAIKLIRQKQFSKIIYIRNSIESLDKGEEVGFLPGLEEKFIIYNHPLMDSLRYISRIELKKKNRNFDEDDIELRMQENLKKYKIYTMWVGELRGRTISDAFVIIDEAQNMSNKTMQMVLSRIDDSSKVVILGSNKQIDNFYVNKYTNALTTLLKSTKKEYDIKLYALNLKKVLRGPITKWAEEVFGDID